MGEALNSLLMEMASLDIEKPESSITIANAENTNNEYTSLKTSNRRLRNSSVSDANLHRINRRTIQKPKKQVQLSFESEKDVKDFYVTFNNKNKKVKPILLETIFEEKNGEPLAEESIGEGSKDMGKKLKRVIKCCNGLNVSKTLARKRKAKVKHFFSARKKPQKIALAKFMEYFKEKTSENGKMEQQ